MVQDELAAGLWPVLATFSSHYHNGLNAPPVSAAIHGTDAREDWQEEEHTSIHRVGTGGGAVVSLSTRRLGNVMPWSASVYQACIGLQNADDSEIETETAVSLL